MGLTKENKVGNKPSLKPATAPNASSVHDLAWRDSLRITQV